jgi:hypothetical protein
MATWSKLMRRVYPVRLIINEWFIEKVVIDDHYELKHSESINDLIILKLVAQLDGKKVSAENVKETYSYFLTVGKLEHKRYRLIWLHEKDENYIGVINAYRV